MTIETTYTMYREREGGDDDVVVLRNATCIDVMRHAAEHDGDYYSCLSQNEYDTFLHYAWAAGPKAHNLPTRGPILSATVPKTGDEAAERASALAMIAAQFLRNFDLYWPGGIATDVDYDRRAKRIAERKAARIEHVVCTQVIDGLIDAGYALTGNLLQPERAFWRSYERDLILDHLFEVKDAEFHVHGPAPMQWIRFCLGREGCSAVESYSTAIAAIVERIVDPHVPQPADRVRTKQLGEGDSRIGLEDDEDEMPPIAVGMR